MRRILPLFAVAALAALATAQSPLTSLFASNNSGSPGGAVYFDLTVNTPVIITQIDINGFPATGTLDVYTISGSSLGNMGNQALWTGPSVLGSPVTIVANNTAAPAVLSSPLILGNGTWGVALVAQGFQHAYTNGTGANQTYSTVEMTFSGGNADNIPWSGGAFTPRVANVSIHYTAGGQGTVFSTKTNYGSGCGDLQYNSLYEMFSATLPHDLTTSIQMINTGTGYIALQGAGTLRGSATATNLALTDDVDVNVPFAMGTMVMPIPGGSTNQLTICDNGFVSVQAGNQTGFSASAAEILSEPQTAWYHWGDLQTANGGGGGDVFFEETATHAYVIYDAVQTWGSTAVSTFELHFDKASGNVEIVFGTVDLSTVWGVGFSAGGPSNDPGGSDLSDPLTYPVQIADPELNTIINLAADARPIFGTTINMTVDNLQTSAIFGAVTIGLTKFAQPVDLTGLGMAGCYQYSDQLANILFFPAGAAVGTVPFAVPGLPAAVGVTMQTQGFVYDPIGANTGLGALATGGLELGIGDW